MERSLSDCFRHSLQWEVPWFSWREPVLFHDISRLSFRKITESLPWTFENSMLSDRSDFDCKSYVPLSTQHVVDDPQWWFPSAWRGKAPERYCTFPSHSFPLPSSPPATTVHSGDSYQLSCGFHLGWTFIGTRGRKLTAY